MAGQDDRAFREWYARMAQQYDLNPNPDSPDQFYDYRGAFKAGAKPDATGHWPSDFKRAGHPAMVVGGFNVQTGLRVPGTKRAASEAELVQLGWDPETAKKLMATPESQPSVLAQKIRAKFPGAYDDIDDATLEKAVLAKHPEYADLAEPEPTPQAPAEERSVGGFLSNILPSAGRFIRDTVLGANTAVEAISPKATIMRGVRMIQDPAGEATRWLATAKAIPGALAQGVKDRYGSVENVKNTLYTDPVGVLSDVSTIAGIGASTKVPKVAGMLGKIEAATNPLTLPGKAAQMVANKASSAIIKGTLRPSKAIRDDFGGADAIAETVKKERVFSEASTAKKLNQSTKQADDLLEARERAGVPGVDRGNVTGAILREPAAKAARRADLGDVDQSQALFDRALAIETRNQPEIPLTRAQALKKEAQEMAYEAGADNLSVKKATEQAVARAFKEGIEARVPEVGPINQRSQELLGAKRAFTEAQDRPNALTNMLALGAGGTVGAGTGDLGQALATAIAMKAMNSPRAGALAGIGINEVGKAAINPDLLRAALIARLLGQEQ